MLQGHNRYSFHQASQHSYAKHINIHKINYSVSELLNVCSVIFTTNAYFFIRFWRMEVSRLDRIILNMIGRLPSSCQITLYKLQGHHIVLSTFQGQYLGLSIKIFRMRCSLSQSSFQDTTILFNLNYLNLPLLTEARA